MKAIYQAVLVGLSVAALCGPATEPASAHVQDVAVIEQARRVADWQLDHLDAFDYVSTFREDTEDPVDWIQATWWAGLADFADTTGDARYAEAVTAHGAAQAWGFGRRPRHADADAIGHAWVWAARRVEGAERAERLAPVRARFDAVLADPSDVPLIFGSVRGDPSCQDRWCWSDAVFMAPPVWAALSDVTGDPAYWRHADRELQATIAQLYDAQDHLFYRDSRFIGRISPAGNKVFWSRGNGWAYAGLARILSVLPADDPARPRYLTLFREMSDRLRGLQGEDGFWPVSLLDVGGPHETSGTAFFVYGMAWGVNQGILDAGDYGPAVSRGWTALSGAVGPDGRLGWVQQVGEAPDHVRAEDTQLYGVGALLLAAGQVSRRDRW